MSKVSINLYMVAHVRPQALHRQAEHLGWTKVPYANPQAVLYRHPDPSRPDLLIPTTTSIGDYRAVVQRLVEDFARAAGVSRLSMLNRLSDTEPVGEPPRCRGDRA